jgi:hypothetical protein
MKPSVRQVLADSHVAAIAIVLLLLWPIEPVFSTLWQPVYSLGTFLATAVAIRGVTSGSLLANAYDRLTFGTASIVLFEASSAVTAAWLLSRWVYGEGPLPSLSKYRGRLPWRRHA